jgi:hypothetical protein
MCVRVRVLFQVLALGKKGWGRMFAGDGEKKDDTRLGRMLIGFGIVQDLN